MTRARFFANLARWSCLLALLGVVSLFVQGTHAVMADSLPQVEMASAAAGPRAVEGPTQKTIVRDYGYAWKNLASAFDQNSVGLLDAYFTSTAKSNFATAVAEQQKAGLRTQYDNQTHKLEVVFYAPEGDVMELQDTAEYDLHIFHSDKLIHTDHVVLRYVVLMTPAADRWVVRQLQAVPQF